jgi:hypothetical protein
LYTLNWESVVLVAAAGGGGDAAGSGTAAAAVAVVVVGVGSVLEASSALGAVDARVGGDDVAAGLLLLLLLLLLLGVDIGSELVQVRHLCGTPTHAARIRIN